MDICKKRCRYCHRWFEPDRRKIDIQRTCMRRKCQRKRQAETSQGWRAEPENAVSYQDRRTEIVKWAKEEDYWKERRRRDPDYRRREAQRMRNKRKDASVRAVLLKTVAKQISITGISVEERARSLGLEVVSVAKQISIHPFLIGKRMGDVGFPQPFSGICVAKQISIPWECGTSIMAA